LSAQTHASAKEILEEHSTHPNKGVIVLDLEKSEQNGAEVIKILRDRDSDVPVVLLANDPNFFIHYV